MASIINASTTSTSGLVQTADASGVLQLQSNGVTGLTVGTGGGGNGGVAGTANTGGGAGGGDASAGGKNGGSGVVFISIPTSKYTGTTTGSPTITINGLNTVLKYTSSGTYTA